MTDTDIKQLLKSSLVNELEASIAVHCNTYVNKNHLKFTIDIVRREISTSGLTFDYIKEMLTTQNDALTSLSINILKETIGGPLVEKYPEGEKLDENEKSTVEKPEGLGIGFSITYAIYLHFLQTNNQEQLVNYLKKERIPKANSFAEILKRLYSN